MIVDDESFAKEVSKLSSKIIPIENLPEPQIITSLDLIRAPQVVDIKRGRSAGRVEIPNSIRALVAEEVINGAKASDVSKAFGVSPSSISAYKNDATSTASYDSPNKELKESNDLVRTNITNQARDKLLLALDHVTSDKMSAAKLSEIASVANSMSGIIRNLEPQGTSITNNTQVIVYKPRQREEDEFEVITVNE